MYQDPRRGTCASLTVQENLALTGLVRPSIFRRPQRSSDPQLAVPLAPGGQQVEDLSGGQRQILALAMALSGGRRPALLLLDEHTAALDAANAALCMAQTLQVTRALRTTVIMVTHVLSHALKYGDRLLVLREGRLSADLRQAEQSLNIEAVAELCGYA
jgi:putative ABC transport system ATP-binding protein